MEIFSSLAVLCCCPRHCPIVSCVFVVPFFFCFLWFFSFLLRKKCPRQGYCALCVLNHLLRCLHVEEILPVLITECASHPTPCPPPQNTYPSSILSLVTDNLSGCTKFTYTLLQLILLYYDCRVYFCIYMHTW